jgi:hypothetical protein
MANDLLTLIKSSIGNNKLFRLEDISLKGRSPDAVKMAFSRYVRSKELIRMANGVYYLPSESTTDAPDAIDLIEFLYCHDNQSYFGFYTGSGFISQALNQQPFLEDKLEIMSNKTTNGKIKITQGGKAVILRKPYFTITESNYTLNALLSYIAMTPLDQVKTNYSLLANYIRTNHLSANDVIALAPSFPAKTMAKLLASDLYRSLWKH